MKIKILLIFVIISISLILTATWIMSARALDKPKESTILIHNSQFVDAIPISESKMQELLNQFPGPLKNYQVTVDGKVYSGARILVNASLGRGYTVNPRVLLTIIELKSSLLTRPDSIPTLFNNIFDRGGMPSGFGHQVRWLSDYLGEAYLYYITNLSQDEVKFAATYAIRDVLIKLGDHPNNSIYEELLQFSDLYKSLFDSDPMLPLQVNQSETIPFLRKPINQQYELNLLHGAVNSFFDHELPTYRNNNEEVRLFNNEVKPDNDTDLIVDNQCDTNHLGYGTNYACYDGHDGLDYDVANNQEEDIVAAADGEIYIVCHENEGGDCDVFYGNYIVITHTLGYQTLYAHLKEIDLNPSTNLEWDVEDNIQAGQVVGDGGCSGDGCENDSDHLHFVVWRNGIVVDPFGWWNNVPDPWAEDDRGEASHWLWHVSNVTDDRAPGFESFGQTNLRTTAAGWHGVDSGYEGHYWWVNSVEQKSNWGVWGLFVPQDGRYSIEAYIPQANDVTSWTTSARYTVNFCPIEGELQIQCELESVEATLDQSIGQDDWYTLTRSDTQDEWFEFDGNRTIAVILTDVTGETDRQVVFDALRINADSVTAGLQYLRHSQNPDNGSWSNSVGITSLAVLTFLNAGFNEQDEVVSQAIDYIRSYTNTDGTICLDCGHATYETSLALIALRATHNEIYLDEILAARNWLVTSQWDEDSLWDPITEDHAYWGGFGYGSHTRPDLSNTQFALLALEAADLPLDDENGTWEKALKFVSRCQNRTESNDGFSPGDDGGFMYLPGYSIAGDTVSTGSMTGAGIWGLALSGITTQDGRFADGIMWVSENYTWDYNPLTDDSWGDYSLYYYYMSMAKALSMARKFTVVTPDEEPHDWNTELRQELESRQDPEAGYWVNSNSNLWENVPDLATSYALLALQTRQLPFGAELEMAIILHSPADLHLYDAYGRHVGKNYDTGEVEIQIPGAVYTQDDPQVITVTQLVAGNYRVEMLGTSVGSWELEIIGKQNDQVVSYDSYLGDISIGEYQASDLSVGAFDGALSIFSTSPANTPVLMVYPTILDIEGYPGVNIQKSLSIANAADIDVPIQSVSILPVTLKNETGTVLPVDISPSQIESIPVGSSQTIILSVEIAEDQPLGNYSGLMTIETLNAGVRSVLINLSIEEVTPLFVPVVVKNMQWGFDSQFNGDAAGWEVHSGSWQVDSNYYSTTGLPDSWSSSSYISKFTDFDYQAKIRRSGCLECSNGVIVRGVAEPFGTSYRWNSGYGFFVNQLGQYSVFKYKDGTAILMQDWTDSSAINQGENWNILRVVAIGSDLYFYVNGTMVWSGNDPSYTSGRVGILMYRTAESSGDQYWVDWAMLSPLDGDMIMTDIIITEQQTLNSGVNPLSNGDDRYFP
jgi:squalene-hopene/tetraprenyl-beta-curcumene cyclase